MKAFLQKTVAKIKSQFREHRMRSIILLLLLLGAGYFTYTKVRAGSTGIPTYMAAAIGDDDLALAAVAFKAL